MRIDKFFAEKFGSRSKAAEAVERGEVLVNGRRVRPSYDVREDDNITFCPPVESFVSNGGYKLSKALKDFNLDVSGGVFADIGASNGGFTDCLFKAGAKKVYCIDVGENQLDESLGGKNIVVIDNFNARNMTKDMFAERLDGIVADVSFISLTYLLPCISQVLDQGKFALLLIKPQFECDGGRVGKRGIVKDAAVHRAVIKKIYECAAGCRLAPVKLTNAPIREGKNKEYLICLVKDGIQSPLQLLLRDVIL